MNSFYLFYVLLLLYVKSVSTSVTTVQNNTQIHCIYNNVTWPVYITPPVVKPKTLTSPFFFENDEWHYEDARGSLQAPVTDKRWEDFKIINNTESYTFGNSMSFSIYTEHPNDFTLFMKENYLKRNRRYDFSIQEQTHRWIHFGVFLLNDKVFILRDGHHIHTINGMNPDKLLLKSHRNQFYLKPHEYFFLVARNVTKGRSSTFETPPMERECFILYTSMCEKCYLEVIIENDEGIISNTTVTFFDGITSFLKSWFEYPIEVRLDKGVKITIYRRTTDGSERGYWAMDGRLCPHTKNNMSFFQTNLPQGKHSQYQCKILNDEIESRDTNSTFCNETGKLGPQCNINCETVLGPEFKYCQKHRICTDGTNCYCAWGHYGIMCQNSCENSTWGLSCQNHCPSDCTKCDKITGNCMRDNNNTRYIAICVGATAASLILVIGPVITIFILYKRKKWQRVSNFPYIKYNRSNTESTD